MVNEMFLPDWLRFMWALMGGVILPIGALAWALVFTFLFLIPMKRMQVEALRLGRQTTTVLEELEKEIKPIINDVKTTAEKVGRMVDKFEKHDLEKVQGAINKVAAALDDGILEKAEGHLAAIRKRIERDTTPLPVNHRPEVPAGSAAGDPQKQ
jgi:ribosomal protein L30/L7E